MERHFKLAVIGTGSAGSTTASLCSEAGWDVAIIDSRPFGGTCALRGCDPKKVLVGAAEVVDAVRRMSGKGVAGRGASIDWAELMRFKRAFTDPVPERRERSFAEQGINAFHGRARFTGSHSLEVGSDTLTADHFLIATGARPATLNIPGEQYVTDSSRFLELESLPADIAFIGGGYISFEFAHVAARAGAQARILHHGNSPLRGFDPDLVDQLVKTTREIGVDVRLGTDVQGVEKSGDRLTLTLGEDGRHETVEADLVVHGAGRVPEIDDLNLKAAGVQFSDTGIMVNQYLQSVSNSAVYAAGDCAALPLPRLTPVSGTEGEIAGFNLTRGNQRKLDITEAPSVVFTIPPLARVGLLEHEADAQGLRYRSNLQDTSGWYSSRRLGVLNSGSKVLVEEGSHRILGAHLFGPHSDEVINLFAVAIRFHLTTMDLDQMLFAYPTGASDVGYMI